MSTARDVMNSTFQTLRPEMSLVDAVDFFRLSSAEQNRLIFGMAVMDDEGRLAGMLSMYDILLLIRPKHTEVWGMMEDIDVSGLLEAAGERATTLRVEDIMTVDVVTVKPEAHILTILDTMIRKHIRRIPVMNHDKMEGIVYLSDLYNYLVKGWSQ